MPTTPPTITPAPSPAPQRGDQSTFSARVDSFVTWLTNAVAQFDAVATNVFNNATEAFNSAATAVNAPGSNATSTTSLTVSVGSKSLTVQTGKAFVVGMFVVIARTSAPTTQSMYGQIASYNSGTGALVVDVTNIIGSVTATDWTISLSGGAALVTNNVTNNTVTYVGFKNKIRNPEMLFDQLYVGSTNTPTGNTIALDGWGIKSSQASKISFRQVADAPPGATMSVLLTVASQSTLAAGDTFAWYQRIEGMDCADLGFGTAGAQSIAIGFWAKASTTGTYTYAIKNSAANRAYIGTYTITAANTWQQFSAVIPGDTTGTWLTGIGVQGLGIYFDLGCGSNFNTTAGSWLANNGYNTASSIKFASLTAGATLNITRVELMKSTVVSTSFEPLPYSVELERLQRYVEKSYEPLVGIGAVTNIGAASYEAPGETGQVPFGVVFKSTKCIVPTVTWFNPSSGAQNSIRNNTGAINIAVTGTSSLVPVSTKSPGVPLYTIAGNVGFGDLLTAHWRAIAELPGA